MKKFGKNTIDESFKRWFLKAEKDLSLLLPCNLDNEKIDLLIKNHELRTSVIFKVLLKNKTKTEIYDYEISRRYIILLSAEKMLRRLPIQSPKYQIDTLYSNDACYHRLSLSIVNEFLMLTKPFQSRYGWVSLSDIKDALSKIIERQKLDPEYLEVAEENILILLSHLYKRRILSFKNGRFKIHTSHLTNLFNDWYKLRKKTPFDKSLEVYEGQMDRFRQVEPSEVPKMTGNQVEAVFNTRISNAKKLVHAITDGAIRYDDNMIITDMVVYAALQKNNPKDYIESLYFLTEKAKRSYLESVLKADKDFEELHEQEKKRPGPKDHPVLSVKNFYSNNIFESHGGTIQ